MDVQEQIEKSEMESYKSLSCKIQTLKYIFQVITLNLPMWLRNQGARALQSSYVFMITLQMLSYS